MPVTFSKLVELSRTSLGPELEQALALSPDQLTAVLGRIVKATVHGLGLYVNEYTGEVDDPRPRTVDVAYQQHARWSGGPNRKRRR